MKFVIEMPKDLTTPKGLYLPEPGQVGRVVGILEIIKAYIKAPELLEDCDFTIMVSDEVSTYDGQVVSCCETGEGIILHPSPSQWDLERILDMVLEAIFGCPE